MTTESNTPGNTKWPLGGRYGRYGKYAGNLLALSDLVVVNAVFAAVVLCNPGAWFGQVKLVWLVLNIAYLPAAWLTRQTRNRRTVQMDRVIFSALVAAAVFALTFFSLLFFLDVETPGSGVYLELYAGILVTLTLWWMAGRQLLKRYRRRGGNYLRVLIVGTGPGARRLYRAMRDDPSYGYRIMGFVDYGYPADFPYRNLYLGNIRRLNDIIERLQIDRVYYALPDEDHEALHLTLQAADAHMIPFLFVPALSPYLNRAFEIEPIGPVTVMEARPNPLASPLNRAAKRASDILFSGILLLLSPVVYIPVAIAIKLSSPGPVLFKQQRTGYKGREFTCYKFRTMRVNPDSDNLQASRDDPRKTRIGEFLRRTSIDELPQFLNVFRGEMSVVGPRPHMLRHTEQYSQLIDKYMVRHLVKPGITGWAQVNGYRGETRHLWQMEKRVQYDVWYIENWSLLLDLKIVVRTVINAALGEENAF